MVKDGIGRAPAAPIPPHRFHRSPNDAILLRADVALRLSPAMWAPYFDGQALIVLGVPPAAARRPRRAAPQQYSCALRG